MLRIFLIAFCLTSLSTLTFSQTITSAQDGDWDDPNTWSPNTVPDNSNSTSIIVNSGHTVTVTASTTIDQAVISAGGTVIINAGQVLTIAAGAGDDLTINGELIINGSLTIFNDPPPPPVSNAVVRVNGTIRNSGAINNAAASRLFMEAGSEYIHEYTTTPGIIPLGSWNDASTCTISGYTTNATAPTNLNQAFGNFIWDTPNQDFLSFIDLGGLLTQVDGNLSILNSPGYIGFTQGIPFTLNVGGNLFLGSEFVFSDAADVTINVAGNTEFAGGFNFLTGDGNIVMNLTGDLTFSGGTHDFCYSSGTTTINLSGDLNFNGGELSESVPVNQVINFNSLSEQFVSGESTIISNDLNYVVNNLAIVDLGTSSLRGGGSFTLSNGGTIQLGSTDNSSPGDGALSTNSGVGNIQVTGSRTYSAGGNIIYNGSGSQNIGNGFPSTAVNLEIDNTNGVTNNNNGTTNVIGNLTLTAGSLNIGNTNTLNIQSNLIVTGGTIGGDITSNLTFSGTGSITGSLTFTSGAEELNNFTINRSGIILLGSDLNINGVLSFPSTGNLNISDRTLTIEGNNGDITQTGSGGFISNNNTNLILAGTEALTAIPFSGAGNQLNNVTFSRTGTSPSYIWDASVVINGTVNLNSGTLTHNSGLTMADGSTFIRNAGSSITTNAPLTTGSYNVTYNGNLTTGLELPSGTTELNNLVVGGNVVLDKSITVNGVLTFSSGVFNAGTNSIDIQGNLVSNAGATLTSSPITFSGTTTISGTTAPTFGSVTITGTVNPSINIRFDGNLVNNGTLSVGTGSQTTTFGGSTTISGSSVSSFNNVTIASTLTAPTGNFNVAGNWVNNGTFVRGPRTNTVTFNGTTSISGSTLTQFSGVTISGTLNSPATLSLAGNFTNNGTFNSGTGTVLFSGNNQQVVQGSTVTTFNNITVTNVSGPPAVQVLSNQNLRGVLTLSAGSVFDADGGGSIVFTLLSSADNPTVDASIASLPAGAAVTGNVTVQRYMAIEGANNGRIYRYISSPVQTPAVSQIQTEIPITGTFTGASACTGCGTNQSMFAYDESVITGDLNDGYINFPAASNTETLATGRGYAIFVRGNITPISSAGSALWDVRAPINSGNISFNSHVSFTSSGNIANDGWNLVGNPYPSTIDWDAVGWTRTGINNAIYMRDNGVQSPVIATYIGGIGLNNGSRYIPIGQAFFVKSDGGPIDFQATEGVKVAGTQSEFIREGAIDDMLRIALRGGLITDEMAIRFDASATEDFDHAFDAYKLKNAAFNISSKMGDVNLAVNTLSELTCVNSIELEITDATPGPYKLEFSEFDSFVNESISIRLVDNLLGETINVREQSSYEFVITDDEQSQGTRFTVVFSLPEVDQSLIVQGDPLNCAGNEYEIILPSSQAGVGYYAMLGGNSISELVTGNGGELSLSIDSEHLQPGENSIIVYAKQASCDAVPLDGEVAVNVVELIPADIQTSGNTLISNYETGNQWYLNGTPIEEATGQFLEAEVSGLYSLIVTSSDGCTTSSERQFVVTDVETSSDKFIRVYPNPAKDYLSVEIDSVEPVQLKLLNVLGIEVASENLASSEPSKQAEFDLTNQSNGMYILHVQKGGRVHQVKIIKTNE